MDSHRGRSFLTNLITFYDEMTGLVDKGRAVDIVYPDISKAFGTVSHRILLDKLMNYGLDEQRGDWKLLKLPRPEGGDQWQEV